MTVWRCGLVHVWQRLYELPAGRAYGLHCWGHPRLPARGWGSTKWMSRNVMRGIKRKEKVGERLRRRRSRGSYTSYCRIRNRVTSAVWDGKCIYENSLA